MDAKFTELVEQLNGLDCKGMYGSDFLHTWDKTTDELKALYIVADALRQLRENNVTPKIFDSGLAVSLFRDNSTRTRFSFSKAANLLGLELQDLDEKKSQIAQGETVRETATTISFMADVFDMHRVGMCKEASYKPYAIAAMMFLQKVADPAATLKALDERNAARWFQD